MSGRDRFHFGVRLIQYRVGFWHPSLKHVRREAASKWILTTTILMAFILGVLSIYWGALYRAEENLSSLVIYVIDFDGQAAPYNTSGIQPVVGPAIVQLAQQIVNSGMPHLGYGSLPAANFNYDPIQVRQAVYDWDAWAAIIINPNATAMLYSAVQNGNASYDPMGACQLIYQDSRDDTNWFDFIYPQIVPFMTEATSMVGQEWTRMVMQNATTNNALVQNLARVPQALSPAIGFSMYNLRPFYPYQAIPAVSIGLIYLIIVSFFSFSFYLPIHFKVWFFRFNRHESPADDFTVSQTRRTPTSQVLPAHHLALVLHNLSLFHALPRILTHLSRLPDQLPRRKPCHFTDRSHPDQLRQPHRIRIRHLPRLLGAQFLWHDRPRSGMRERHHGYRTTMDGSVAHLLGHYECQHGFL